MESSSASGNLSPVPLNGKLPTISYSASNNKNFKMLPNGSPKDVKVESSIQISGHMMPSGSAFVPRLHQHLQQDDINSVVSPPLTPSTSPAAFLNGNIHFKRKYSVDVGPFGFNSTNSASMIPAVNACVQEDFYRRHSTCSEMSMDDYSHGADHFGFLTTTDMGQHHGLHGSLPSPPRVDHRTNFSQFETHPTEQFYQDNSQQIQQLQNQVHHADHVQGSQNSQSKRKTTGNRHVCKYPYCGWSFKRYEHLKRHMLVHTGERPHVCNYPGCGKSFSRSDNFAAHYRTHTRRAMMQRRMSTITSEYVPSDLSSNAMSFVNNEKFQEYSTNEQYNIQDQKPNKQQNIHNPSSPQSPSTPSALSQLIDYQQHHDQSQHLYDAQSSSFTSLDRQFIPMEDPIPTDSFMAAASERQPDSVHNQSRRPSTSSKACGKVHVCQVPHCQRKFKRLEHLKRHMRTHTMERPFTCSIKGCNKSFSRSDNLSQHIKTHQRREMRANAMPEDHSESRFNNSTSPEQQVRESHDTNNVNMMNMSWHAGNASTVGC